MRCGGNVIDDRARYVRLGKAALFIPSSVFLLKEINELEIVSMIAAACPEPFLTFQNVSSTVSPHMQTL